MKLSDIPPGDPVLTDAECDALLAGCDEIGKDLRAKWRICETPKITIDSDYVWHRFQERRREWLGNQIEVDLLKLPKDGQRYFRAVRTVLGFLAGGAPDHIRFIEVMGQRFCSGTACADGAHSL